jgi:hypothetical protein
VLTGLRLAGPKVDHLRVQAVLGLLMLTKEVGLGLAALHEGLQERHELEVPKQNKN